MQIIQSKQLPFFFILIFIMTVSLSYPSISFARNLGSSTSEIEAAKFSDDVEVDFALLGYKDQIIQGPYDLMQLFFNLPSDWELTADPTLVLELDVFLGARPELENHVGGYLDVELNEVFLDRIILDEQGEQSLSILISSDALIPSRDDGQFMLELTLITNVACGVNDVTRVVIRDNSRLVLPHILSSPSTNLMNLPRPIFQEAFELDEAIIVVADEPSQAELQSALTIAAGFGKLTDGGLRLDFLQLNELTADMRNNSHLIFVGHPENFPLLYEAKLPAPPNSSGFSARGANEKDGIVQMVDSPWNQSKVLLVVGGNNDEAIIKSAQAISVGNIRTGSQTNLAIVSDIYSDKATFPPTISQSEQTFDDMGYDQIIFQDIGRNSETLEFFLPPDQVVFGDGRFELSYANSALLDPARSMMTIYLNNEPITSVQLRDESQGSSILSIPLPSSAVQSGTNQLTLESDLYPILNCGSDTMQDGSLWLNIRPESSLQLPIRLADNVGPANFQLSELQEFFSEAQTLSQSAIIVPFNYPEALQVASQIAFTLGQHLSNESVIELEVLDASKNEEYTEFDRNLIIIGQPTQLRILEELGEALPAQFQPGTNSVQDDVFPISYRLPINLDFGYLELFPAPWNPERTILAVLGNSDQGLRNAANTIMDQEKLEKLKGNFAISDDLQLLVTNTLQESVSQEELNNPQMVNDFLSYPIVRQSWLLPTLIISIGLILTIIVFLAVNTFKWRSSS